MAFSDDVLRNVLPPEEDFEFDKVKEAIETMKKRYDGQLLFIADSLGYALNTPNDYQRVISYCYSANFALWDAIGEEIDPKDKRAELEFKMTVKRIEGTAKSKENFIELAHQIGIWYRIERRQLDL